MNKHYENMKAFYVSIFLMLLCSTAGAQDYSKERIIPPNPIAESFKIYGDIPVSYNTGVPDITIPLYTIQVGDFALPIELKYHINSLRPSSCHSNVALGWSLNYGGIVSRTVYGKPDGFYNFETYGTGMGVGNDNVLRDICEIDDQSGVPGFQHKDAEYDIFNYLIPGASGEFILGANSTAYQMSRKPVAINFVPYENIDITNDHGDIFKFGYGKKESTTAWPHTVTSSWLLSQIALASNNSINYTYEDINYYTTNYQEYQLSITDNASIFSGSAPGLGTAICDGPKHEFVERNISTSHLEKNIKEITFPNGKIVFDLSMDKRTITGVKIYKGTELLKAYEFDCPATGGSMGGMKLLRKITVKDALQNKINEYQFTYYDETIINAETVNTDFWGYCNSLETNYIPLAEYFVKGGQSCCFNCLGTLPYSMTVGRSKEPNTYLWCNALKKITYPTGGFTEFLYSMNQFKFSGEVKNGNGLRVQKITNNDGNGHTTTRLFEYEPADKMGQGIFQPNNFVSTSFSVGLYDERAGNIVRFRTYSSSISSRIAQHLLNIQYSKVTEIIGDGVNNAGKNVYYYEYNNDHERSYLTSAFPVQDLEVPSFYLSKYRNWDNGLLSRKEVYNENSILPVSVNSYSYAYHYDPVPFKNTYVFKITDYTPNYSGYDDITTRTALSASVSDLPPVYGYYNYEIATGWLELASETQTENRDGANVIKITSYEYNGAKTYYPSKITTANSDGNSTIVNRTYPYDYSIAPYNNMVTKNIIYPVVNQDRFKNTKFLDSEKTNYNDWGNNIFKPMTLETKNGNQIDYETRFRFNSYDNKGNLTSAAKENDIPVSYIWSYNQAYPVVIGENVTYDILNSAVIDAGGANLETFWAGFSTIATNASQKAAWKNFNAALRNNATLAKARITTYTYLPLVGMTSQTDPNGITTYYEYDTLGRLKNVKDHEGNILKQTQYHYQNQP